MIFLMSKFHELNYCQTPLLIIQAVDQLMINHQFCLRQSGAFVGGRIFWLLKFAEDELFVCREKTYGLFTLV
jgi:hypothetical protein